MTFTNMCSYFGGFRCVPLGDCNIVRPVSIRTDPPSCSTDKVCEYEEIKLKEGSSTRCSEGVFSQTNTTAALNPSQVLFFQ